MSSVKIEWEQLREVCKHRREAKHDDSGLCLSLGSGWFCQPSLCPVWRKWKEEE